MHPDINCTFCKNTLDYIEALTLQCKFCNEIAKRNKVSTLEFHLLPFRKVVLIISFDVNDATCRYSLSNREITLYI